MATKIYKDYHYSPMIAEELGCANAASIFHNLVYIIQEIYYEERNQHDGRTWTRQPLGVLNAKFKWLSEKQLRTILNSIVDKGYLLKGNYNDTPYDRTLWYAIVDEDRFLNKNKPDNSSPHIVDAETEKEQENADYEKYNSIFPNEKMENTKSEDIYKEVNNNINNNTNNNINIRARKKRKSKFEISNSTNLTIEELQTMVGQLKAIYPAGYWTSDQEALRWYASQSDMSPDKHAEILKGCEDQGLERSLLKSRSMFVFTPKQSITWLNNQCWTGTTRTEEQIEADYNQIKRMESRQNNQGQNNGNNKQANIVNPNGTIQRPRKETPSERYLRELKESRERGDDTEWLAEMQRKADRMRAEKFANKPLGFGELANRIPGLSSDGGGK